MFHFPDHLYRDVGVFLGAGHLIMLVVTAIIFGKYVRAVRNVAEQEPTKFLLFSIL
jgi:hypothetical protein